MNFYSFRVVFRDNAERNNGLGREGTFSALDERKTGEMSCSPGLSQR